MALGIRFNQNAGQPTLQPRVPLKAIGCWTAFDRWTSIPRGPGSSSPHPQKNRGVQVRIEAIRTRCRRGPSRPALPQSAPLRLAHLRPTHFEPAHLRRVYMPRGSTRALGSERRFAGVQVVWSGLTFGTLPWPRQVGRLAGRAVFRSRPVMTGSYCPGLIAWTAVLRAVNAVHPIDYTSSNGFVRTTQGRIVVLR
jgi:hypothetical protein